MRKISITIAAMTMLTAPAMAAPSICEKAAAWQVAGEPGIHECLSHKTVSADCKAVIDASMNKREHECEAQKKYLRQSIPWPPKNMREAIQYCERDSDARESGAEDSHLITVKECAVRIMTPSSYRVHP